MFPVLLRTLPLKEDLEENATVFRCIAHLYQGQHPQVQDEHHSIYRWLVGSHTKGLCHKKQVEAEGFPVSANHKCGETYFAGFLKVSLVFCFLFFAFGFILRTE